MRQVQVQEAAEHFADLIAEAEAGKSLTIVKAGKPVAQIVPFPKPLATELERQAALENLRRIMDHGYDLGGVKITSRDELYDRD